MAAIVVTHPERNSVTTSLSVVHVDCRYTTLSSI